MKVSHRNDVMEFRHHLYVHSNAGRIDLEMWLSKAGKEALVATPTREHWNVIHGRVERTAAIVHDLERLLGIYEMEVSQREAHFVDLTGITIRSMAGLGSLSISDHEPPYWNEASEYDDLLRQERDLLRRIILQGAEYKLMLNPPRRFATKMFPERLKARYNRLIGLLRGESDFEDLDEIEKDLRVINRCQFVINPVPSSNQFIINKQD